LPGNACDSFQTCYKLRRDVLSRLPLIPPFGKYNPGALVFFNRLCYFLSNISMTVFKPRRFELVNRFFVQPQFISFN